MNRNRLLWVGIVLGMFALILSAKKWETEFEKMRQANASIVLSVVSLQMLGLAWAVKKES